MRFSRAVLAAFVLADGTTAFEEDNNFFDFKTRNTKDLIDCLNAAFENETAGSPPHSKLSTNVGDADFYRRAQRTYSTLRNPTAVVFAENTQDVVTTINCARESGYQVSARGRGHQYNGWGAADGSVVIDMQYTCDVDAMVDSIDRSKTGDHIVPGTKYIATIKAQSGCANANWLAGVFLGFDVEDGALASIGSCPSVGITGYSLGGGLGDTSPINGFAMDLIAEYEMVLADGSVVTVSENENEDIYWANRGGGPGMGVITSLTFKVVQSPAPGAFTFFTLTPNTNDMEALSEYAARWQDFLYDHPQSYRFGGSGPSNPYFIFLGPAQEGIEILMDAHLLDDEIMLSNTPFVVKDYDVVCEPGANTCPGYPTSGLNFIFEYKTQAEVQAFGTCREWLTGWKPSDTARSLDVCEDLGIDTDAHCECVPVGNDPCYARSPTTENCAKDQELITAILQNARDANGFFSRNGFDVNVEQTAGPPSIEMRGWPRPNFGLETGGFIAPRLEDSTMGKIAATPGLNAVHLLHGAPMMVPVDATAMPWRNGGLNIDQMLAEDLKILLTDKAYRGDTDNLQGFYNIMGPDYLQNWEQLYFGDHVDDLKEIKLRRDPNGLFNKPMTIQADNFEPSSKPSSGKKADKKDSKKKDSKKDKHKKGKKL